jgi:hypothetical protein
MNAKNIFAIALLITAFVFLIVIPLAIALNETRKEKRAMNTPYNKIGRVLDDLIYLSTKYKIAISKTKYSLFAEHTYQSYIE